VPSDIEMPRSGPEAHRRHRRPPRHPPRSVENYGRYKAKISLGLYSKPGRQRPKLSVLPRREADDPTVADLVMRIQARSQEVKPAEC